MTPFEIAANLIALALRTYPDLAKADSTADVLNRVNEILGVPYEGKSSEAVETLRKALQQ